jgi:hypothetical protein
LGMAMPCGSVIEPDIEPSTPAQAGAVHRQRKRRPIFRRIGTPASRLNANDSHYGNSIKARKFINARAKQLGYGEPQIATGVFHARFIGRY